MERAMGRCMSEVSGVVKNMNEEYELGKKENRKPV